MNENDKIQGKGPVTQTFKPSHHRFPDRQSIRQALSKLPHGGLVIKKLTKRRGRTIGDRLRSGEIIRFNAKSDGMRNESYIEFHRLMDDGLSIDDALDILVHETHMNSTSKTKMQSGGRKLAKDEMPTSNNPTRAHGVDTSPATKKTHAHPSISTKDMYGLGGNTDTPGGGVLRKGSLGNLKTGFASKPGKRHGL